MKKTAVEWLFEQYVNQCLITLEDVQKAKEIEREQIEEAFIESRLTHPMIGFKHETFDQYYNETFNQ
jgi:hypothetical protein